MFTCMELRRNYFRTIDEIMAGRSGYPIISGRVYQVLKNSGFRK